MANEKRLIDANALIAYFKEQCEIASKDSEIESLYTLAALKCCIVCFEQFPTVDAVEVVHAHWEDGCAIHNGKEVYRSIDCSHCNEIFKTDDREYWKARFKVCPFCGAKMDGERKDNE